MKATKRIGLRAYARHRGCSPSAVTRAIKDGRIAKAVRRDKKGHPKIDPIAADREWAAHTDPARGFPTRPSQADVDGRNASNSEAEVVPGEELPSFEESRAKREAFSANLKELEYQKAAGKLVWAHEVRASSFKTARMVRDAILVIPSRVSPILAAMDDPFEIREKLTAELTQALWALSKRIKDHKDEEEASLSQ